MLLSLRRADFEEMWAGFKASLRTLGAAAGVGAMLFASRRQLSALARGEGSYPEERVRRFSLH